jgi:outer membrane protein
MHPGRTSLGLRRRLGAGMSVARRARASVVALLAVLVLALAGPGLASGGPSGVTYGELSQAERIAFIRHLVASGDNAAAQRFLSGSYFNEGDLGYDAAFLQAIVFRRTGRERDAEALLRQIVEERPAYQRARLELASVLAQMGRRDAAAHHLRLLADAAADPGTRRQFEAFIEQMNPEKPFSFGGFVSIAPSTNINGGAGGDTITLGGLPFEIGPRGRARSGVGLKLGLTAALNHRLSENLTLYAAGSGVLSEYSGGEFDTLTGDFRVGLRHNGVRRLIGAELIADRRWIAWRPIDHAIGARLFLRQPLAPRLLYSGELQFADRRYDGDPAARTRTFFGRSRLTRVLSPGRSAHVEAGLVGEDVPARRHHSFTGGYGEIGVQGELPLGINASLAARFGIRDYEAAFPGTGAPRRDEFFELRATLLKRDWNLQGFTPRLGLSYYLQKSNVALYDFDRYAVDVTLTREF